MSQDEISASWLEWALPLLWAKRRILVRSTIIGAVSSIALALLLPVSYQSTVRIMPPDARSTGGTNMLAVAMGGAPASIASGGLATLTSSRSPNARFMSILGSRTAQDDLINRFDLRRVYHTKLYIYARKTLSRNTVIDDDRKTGLLTLTVTGNSPTQAHDLAAAYVEELNKSVANMDTSSAHQERVFLESRLKDIKQDMDAATTQLSQFSSRNATMDMQGQAAVTLNATARLQGELIAAESELDGLQAIYADENSRVREAHARVASLRQQLQALAGNGKGSSIDLDPGQPYPSLHELPLFGATYSQLYQRAKIEETVFEALSKQYELAKVEEAEEIPAVKVLDPPDYPERKSFPPRTLIVLLGTFLAWLLGAVWVVGSYRWGEIESGHPLKRMIKGIQRRSKTEAEVSV
jgi:capsule polysaccharide export protein KpsE/RkpR